MADTVSPETRSRIMRQVRSTDTKPELRVRGLAHRLGYRFRLHRADLPGKPDLVFPSRRKVVFVHGCFWHGHACRAGSKRPKTNAGYWREKIARNKQRDAERLRELAELGWRSLVVWECETNDERALAKQLRHFLGRKRRVR